MNKTCQVPKIFRNQKQEEITQKIQKKESTSGGEWITIKRMLMKNLQEMKKISEILNKNIYCKHIVYILNYF